MAKPLSCVVSVSGIRGIVGENIDVGQVLDLCRAYGRTIAAGGTVVLGRDSRPTGALFAQAAAAGLRAVGCNVIDIGIVPTPTVPICALAWAAAGGVQISASHNPVEWNALKFFDGRGRNIDGAQLQQVLAAYASGGGDLPWSGVGGYRHDDRALDIHLERVLSCVDAARIRTARPRVLVDCVNGAGSRLAPRLLEQLGCEVIAVHDDPSRVFPRDPEPTAHNVRQTGALVAAAGAAVGFVQDPDADRLALIDETGRYIGEEYTLVLCAAARLRAAAAAGQNNPMAVTNVSTSRMLEDVAARLGGRVERTPVGEAHVVDGICAHQAVVGGEGNGGVIDPRVVMGRDSHIGMALIMELLSDGRALSAHVADIPAYAIHKEKVAASRAQVAACAARLAAELGQGAKVDTRDGIKLIWDHAWVHVRASGTEPASRIISEAPTAEEARALASRARLILQVPLIDGHP